MKNDATGLYYARNIAYTPAGGMAAMLLGNGLSVQRSWNDRLQLTGITVAPPSGANVRALGFYPCALLATSCSSGNAGNLLAQTIVLPGLSLTQNFSYDSLSRISSAGAKGRAVGRAPMAMPRVGTAMSMRATVRGSASWRSRRRAHRTLMPPIGCR